MRLVQPVQVNGAPGSPYTRKMLAILRYRRIAYQLLIREQAEARGLPAPKVRLIPTFYFENDDGELEAVVDSTPIVRFLEDEVMARSVIPSDPALAFLNYLLEDYGDEWLTKAMFHYRWAFEADIAHAGEVLPRWGDLTADDETVAPRSEFVRRRQIDRLYVVGSNETTGPIIEASYERLLLLLSAQMNNGPYCFGARPASSDFAIFGQLTQLTHTDPTPEAVARRVAPRVCAWVGVVEDLSGLDVTSDDWVLRDAVPSTLKDLFAEIGRVYVPVMLANAAAVNAGASEVEATVDGARWTQEPFPYQAKTLNWVRQERARLDSVDRAWVDDFLRGTGCEALFA